MIVGFRPASELRRTTCLHSEGVTSHSPGLPASADYPGNRDHPKPNLYPAGVPSFLEPAMSQSLSNIIVHIVFSTKDRQPLLADHDIRSQMHAQLGGTSKTLKCPPIIVGGVADHIHLLARQSRTITLADWVKELKRATSMWVKEKRQSFKEFSWQSGYGAFSVSQSQIGPVVEYIQNQEAHHKKVDFKTELRAFLKRHGVEFDERYVWD